MFFFQLFAFIVANYIRQFCFDLLFVNNCIFGFYHRTMARILGAQFTELYRMSPWGREVFQDGSCQVLMRKAWPSIIEGKVFEKCHATCSIKSMLIIATIKGYVLRQYTTLPTYNGYPVTLSFIYSFRYCWACSQSGNRWTFVAGC